MKKIWLFLVVIIFALSACSTPQIKTNSRMTSSDSPASEPILGSNLKETSEIVQAEAENETIQVKDELEFIEVGIFFDIGAYLYPEGNNIGIQAQFLDDAIHIWGNNKTFRFDYIQGIIIESYEINIIPLGFDHYYSCTELEGSKWKIVLYNKELVPIKDYTADRISIPSIDGNFLVSVDKTITVLDALSGKLSELDLSSLFEYSGSIWISDFDGETVYFSATTNPYPGKDAVGYYNVITGKSALFEDYDVPFSGIPEFVGNNKAWFWQDGSAFGTDGNYCVLLDAEIDAATKIDLNDPTCKMNGNKVISVKLSESIGNTGFGYVEGFIVYFGPEYTQSEMIPIVTDNPPLYRASMEGLKGSEDMKYICIYAASNEKTGSGISQLSPFIYRVP